MRPTARWNSWCNSSRSRQTRLRISTCFRETGPNRVLGGGLLGGCNVRLQARIPALEGGPQVVVQDLRADLEQQMGPPLGPAHLLLLDHPLTHNLVHGRFRE